MIRLASLLDLEQIVDLIDSVPGMRQDYWREGAIEQAIDMSDGLALVWEEEDEILGFICAHDFGFRGYISILVVAENARGKGVGTQLVKHVEDELSARGCSVVISDVMKNAENFFRYLNYKEPESILLYKKLMSPRF